MRRRTVFSRWPRLRERIADEGGIALVMALGIMMVLTIILTTVITFTADGARDAQRVNAGQKATALAEAGLNNAFAVLNQNYPGLDAYPGDPDLLPARTTAYPSGSITWSGVLVQATSATAAWEDEWRLTAVGTVANPTGPGAAPVTRTMKAVVPILIPPTQDISGKGALNWIYAGQDLTFGNAVEIDAQTYAGRDLTLASTSKIRGTAKKAVAGRNLTLVNPQNQIGQLGGSDPSLNAVHVVGQCSSKAQPALHDCFNPPPAGQWATDKIFATSKVNTLAGVLDYIPSFTCCAPYGGSIAPAAAAGTVSDMGYWYRNADLGPNQSCDLSVPTSTTPPRFDTASGTPDAAINNSATPNPTASIDLTPSGSSYTCRSLRLNGSTRGELSWNHSAKTLTVTGTIFIDGSARVTTNAGRYVGGSATLVLTGTFAMKNATMCVNLTGTSCDFSTVWDPNVAALVIAADGDAGFDATQKQANDVDAGNGVQLKGSQFQGGLIANKNVIIETTSKMQGPMVSVYGSVFAGQTGVLTFPAIYFAPSGGGGIAQPLPLPQLLVPQQFEGG